MGISAGFQRKIDDWIIGEDWSVAFCPFLTNINPYKARIFVVGASAQPKVEVDDTYAEELLSLSFYDELYGLSQYSREAKGMIAFTNAISKQAPVVISSINTLMVDSLKEWTTVKKERPADYEKGFRVFREVLAEFRPELLILHGADALKQFRKQFKDELVDAYPQLDKVQELEKIGPFGELLINGRSIKVMACRSLSQYGTGATFTAFEQEIAKNLT